MNIQALQYTMKTEAPTFWLTNISNRNVSLTDLNLTVKAYSSINLLDQKHYKYNLNQLLKSAESGSLFKKRDKLVIRKVAPEILKANVPLNRETFIPSRERSLLVIKEENYEELNISDEQFAKENADIVELDTKPLKKV
jgi:hypothetical protein